MQLEILSPDKHVFSGEVKLVKVPGSKGSFEMMEHHAAIVSTLTEGEVKVETLSGETLRYTITGGMVEMKNNRIAVLVESVEKE